MGRFLRSIYDETQEKEEIKTQGAAAKLGYPPPVALRAFHRHKEISDWNAARPVENLTARAVICSTDENGLLTFRKGVYMTEREMIVLIQTTLSFIEEMIKGASSPGPAGIQIRLRHYEKMISHLPKNQ